MKNGSRIEYFRVEGVLKLTRMRQSEWRRRWGIAGIVEFDAQVGASGDDGWSHSGANFQSGQSTYYIGLDSTPNSYDSWARFTNVTIPGGATILVAYITVQANNSDFDGSGVKSDLFFEDADDAISPTDQAEHAADVRTAASVAWDDVDFVVDTDTSSPDIAAVIQEVVDRGSWASGNAMMLLWDNGAGGTNNMNYRIHTWDSDTARATKLHVEYTT